MAPSNINLPILNQEKETKIELLKIKVGTHMGIIPPDYPLQGVAGTSPII